MKISADVSSLLASDRTVRVENNDRYVTFAITLYKKNNFQEDNETFRSINDYWATLRESQQDEIFRIYEDIAELFDSIKGKDVLREQLCVYVSQLMDFHKTKDVERWVKTQSGIEVPTSITSTYVHDVDKNTTLDKTYTYNDYIGLIALSVILRAMIPIWAMYNKTTKNDSGKHQKEVYSFLLLANSEVYQSESMNRLKRYISANLSKESYTGNHTLNFICSDDLPHHYLALVCVRRLCLGELRALDPRQNLAALIYNSIIDRPGPQGGDFANQVRAKTVPSESGGDTSDNNGSTLELYKARAKTTVGRMAEMEYTFRDPMALALELCPDSKQAHLDSALHTAQDLIEYGIQPPLVVLAQWVMAPVFSPLGIFHMEPDIMVKILAITQTVLRARGFPYLALLSTSYSMVDEEGIRVSQMSSKMHVSDELNLRIRNNFPYRRVVRKKGMDTDEICLVTEDIRALANMFAEYTWRATAEDALVKEVLNTHVRRVPIIPGIRASLGEMICDVEESINN